MTYISMLMGAIGIQYFVRRCVCVCICVCLNLCVYFSVILCVCPFKTWLSLCVYSTQSWSVSICGDLLVRVSQTLSRVPRALVRHLGRRPRIERD